MFTETVHENIYVNNKSHYKAVIITRANSERMDLLFWHVLKTLLVVCVKGRMQPALVVTRELAYQLR